MPEFIYNGRRFYNPVEFALQLIGGTWKMPILWRLKNRTMRYSELQRDIPHITQKMLTTQLKQLEKNGFITKKIFSTVPPKTEYSLTSKGKRALTIIASLREYGLELMRDAGIQEQKNSKKNGNKDLLLP